MKKNKQNTWEINYQKLVLYQHEHGNCLVSRSSDNKTLARWASIQKANKEHLPQDKREKLNSIGFVWDVPKMEWEQNYQLLIEYKQTNGNPSVKYDYTTINGTNLGLWASRQRKTYRKGRLSKDKIDKLDAIGFVWRVLESDWERNYQLLIEYKKDHGDCLVKIEYKTPEGINIGLWMSTQRTAYKNNAISKDKIDKLDAIGFVWGVLESDWERNYQLLVDYKQAYGDCLVRPEYKTANGENIGSWVSTQRTAYKNGTLSTDKVDQLTALGFVWSMLERSWARHYQALVEYKQVNGDCMVKRDYKSTDGINLGPWVRRQRVAFKNGALPLEKIDKLTDLGFAWSATVKN